MRFRHACLTLTVLLLAALLTAPAQAGWGKNRIEGSGDLETRDFDLKDFDAIDMGGAFMLEVRFGSKESVKITVDDNLWDNLEAEVRGGTLEIGWDKNCDPDDDCKVVVVMKKLERLEVHGACEAEVFDFDGDSFEFDVHGAAELEIDGKVNDLEIQISGAADVDARDLKAKHVKARISGAANANVYASESIDARISGAGSLDYWGSPDKKSTSVSGVGSIHSR